MITWIFNGVGYSGEPLQVGILNYDSKFKKYEKNRLKRGRPKGSKNKTDPLKKVKWIDLTL